MNLTLSENTQVNRRTCLGKVYLVGAGPGDPGLLTLKGKGLLECADVVVYDALVSPQILAMINPQAEKIDAGKRMGRHSLLQEETTQLLIENAQTAAIVVRLKGGTYTTAGNLRANDTVLVQAYRDGRGNLIAQTIRVRNR